MSCLFVIIDDKNNHSYIERKFDKFSFNIIKTFIYDELLSDLRNGSNEVFFFNDSFNEYIPLDQITDLNNDKLMNSKWKIYLKNVS
jgi:DNA modification methylase